MRLIIILLFAIELQLSLAAVNNENQISSFIEESNRQSTEQMHQYMEIMWNYYTNMTEENQNQLIQASGRKAEFFQSIAKKAKQFDIKNVKSESLRRQLQKISSLGTSILSKIDFANFTNVTTSMERHFAQIHLCDFHNSSKCQLSLNPDLIEIFRKNRNPEMLKYYWLQFYNGFGDGVRDDYEKYIELRNKAARMNGFNNTADAWLSEYEYEPSNLVEQLEAAFEIIKPIYDQIHAYVRYHLRKFYGFDIVVSADGPIPMHLLGDVWAESWTEIADICMPFPNKSVINVTAEMLNQNYTARKIYQIGDDFFVSMNLTQLPKQFWEKSIFEKPADDDRKMICYPSSWGFYKENDYRIMHCARIEQSELYVAHHELGHIQYYLQNQHLPYAFRSAPNAAFGAALGDAISLSLSTPEHMQRIGLLKNIKTDEETRINRLFAMALNKIVSLPFALTIEKYRWALFRGEIKKENWNCEFWKLREKYSGIKPPEDRNEQSFDAAAKYHVTADIEYLRYFIGNIMQFQFYKKACIEAGMYNPKNVSMPLDSCHLFGKTQAGNFLKKIMSLGSSKPWPLIMQNFTEEGMLSGMAIAEYFEPLRVWLETENKKNNVHIGWT